MKRINDHSYIVSIVLINIGDGAELSLYTKKDSRCHFSDEFSYGDYKIRFRLDWGDIKNGEPVLDADISFAMNPTKKYTGPGHHTWKDMNPSGQYIYDFRFKDLEFRFLARKTVQHDIPADATIAPPKCD